MSLIVSTVENTLKILSTAKDESNSLRQFILNQNLLLYVSHIGLITVFVLKYSKLNQVSFSLITETETVYWLEVSL